MIKKILVFLLAFSIAGAVGASAYIYIPRFAGTIYNHYISPLIKFHAGILDFSFGSEHKDGETEDAAAPKKNSENGEDRGDPEHQEDGELNGSGGFIDYGNNGEDSIGENNSDSTSGNDSSSDDGSSGGGIEDNGHTGQEGNGEGNNGDSPAFHEISEVAEEELRDKIVEVVVAFISKGGTVPDASMLDKLTFEDKLNVIRLLQSIAQSDREEISRLVKNGNTEEASKSIKDILQRNLDFAELKSLYALIVSND